MLSFLEVILETLYNYKNQYDRKCYIEECKKEKFRFIPFSMSSIIEPIDGEYNKDTNIFKTSNTDYGAIFHLTQITGFVEKEDDKILKVIFEGIINYDILLQAKEGHNTHLIKNYNKEIGDKYSILYFDISKIKYQSFIDYKTYIIRYIKPYFNDLNNNIQSYEKLEFNTSSSFFIIRTNMGIYDLGLSTGLVSMPFIHKNGFLNDMSDSFIDLNSLSNNMMLIDAKNEEIYMKSDRDLYISDKILIPVGIRKSKRIRKFYTATTIPNPLQKSSIVMDITGKTYTEYFIIVKDNKIIIDDTENVDIGIDKYEEFTLYELCAIDDTAYILTKTFYCSSNPSEFLINNICTELEIPSLNPSNQVTFLEKNKKYGNFGVIKKEYNTYNIDIIDSTEKQIIQKKIKDFFKIINKEV